MLGRESEEGLTGVEGLDGTRGARGLAAVLAELKSRSGLSYQELGRRVLNGWY